MFNLFPILNAEPMEELINLAFINKLNEEEIETERGLLKG